MTRSMCLSTLLLVIQQVTAFQVIVPTVLDVPKTALHMTDEATPKKDNKAMAFLKKVGKVGGAANKDFKYAVGVDEGPAGKSSGNGYGLKKTREAFMSCVDSGIIDNMSETFPTTSCGTSWSGFTDQVMGGVSIGNLVREEFDGRVANVLRGRVSTANNGGFIQMATNLSPASSSHARLPVDASKFTGVELDVQSFNDDDDSTSTENFNVHVKNDACSAAFSSYRASFDATNGQWTTVQIPFSDFKGKGPGAENIPFDASTLSRIGIVAIGRPMKVKLAVSGVRFY